MRISTLLEIDRHLGRVGSTELMDIQGPDGERKDMRLSGIASGTVCSCLDPIPLCFKVHSFTRVQPSN